MSLMSPISLTAIGELFTQIPLISALSIMRVRLRTELLRNLALQSQLLVMNHTILQTFFPDGEAVLEFVTSLTNFKKSYRDKKGSQLAPFFIGIIFERSVLSLFSRQENFSHHATNTPPSYSFYSGNRYL